MIEPKVRRQPTPRSISLRRLFAYAIREALELWRDPIRLGFALLGTTFLMLVLGFGITTDVDHLSFAALDRDRTQESRAYLEELRGSRYFDEKPPLTDYADLEKRLESGRLNAAIEIPPNFGRDITRGRSTEVGVWIDGAMPFRARDDARLFAGGASEFLSDLAMRATGSTQTVQPATVSSCAFATTRISTASTPWCRRPSRYFCALIPAILMALAIVREKELGSITNLYVTPVTRIEFLLGKQLPYIVIAIANFAVFLDGYRSLCGATQGKLPRALAGGRSLCHEHDRARHADLRIHEYADCRSLRHDHPDFRNRDPIQRMLTPVSALQGLAAIMGRLFPIADQRRNVYEGAGLPRSRRQPLCFGCVHPGVDAVEPLAAAQARALTCDA